MHLASRLPLKACGLPWDFCMGSVMRLSRCHAQPMLPATDGMFRARGGWFLSFAQFS